MNFWKFEDDNSNRCLLPQKNHLFKIWTLVKSLKALSICGIDKNSVAVYIGCVRFCLDFLKLILAYKNTGSYSKPRNRC